MLLKGKSASEGVVVGRALTLKKEALVIKRTHVVDVDAEIARFREAVQKAKDDLIGIREQVRKTIDEDKAQIFDSHILILDDPEMISETENAIRADKINAEAAYKAVSAHFVSIFETMDNEYMRERAADILDISDRVLRTLAGVSIVNLALLKNDVILVAHDLTPSETGTMNREKVLGILTNIGGKTSHMAIMARTLEIPAVLGLQNITEQVKDGDWIAFDGSTGQVELNPSDAIKREYLARKDQLVKAKFQLQLLMGKPSQTTDGHRVELAGNIGTPHDINSLLKYDAEGVGLYRTEFLFMDRSEMPSEEAQYRAYRVVLEAMGSKPVIIRTLDIGGDKSVPYINIGKEDNPFLGYRAIRYCLGNPDIFRVQLRALLRASVHGNLKIMFPMISSLEELLAARAHLEASRQELAKNTIAMADKVDVGMMIEIPSAALISDILAQHCDFLSIGTNDLIQYTMAVDRMNEKVQDLYDPFHPGLLRLIRSVIENGHKHNAMVGMCGEVAGSELHIPLLLGMGLDEFSMAPTGILKARNIVRKWSKTAARALVERVMAQPDSASVRQALADAKP